MRLLNAFFCKGNKLFGKALIGKGNYAGTFFTKMEHLFHRHPKLIWLHSMLLRYKAKFLAAFFREILGVEHTFCIFVFDLLDHLIKPQNQFACSERQ